MPGLAPSRKGIAQPDSGTTPYSHCRVVHLDWQLDRVYFLTFLNPLRGQPDPALTARFGQPM